MREIDKLKRYGFLRRRLIVFQLPTEYRGSKTTYRSEEGYTAEVKLLTVDPSKYRTLRKKFYSTLHRVAWKALPGWFLYEDVGEEELKELDKIVREINRVAETSRTVYVVDCYMPKDVIEEWLSDYILEVKTDMEKLRAKIREEEEKKEKVKRLRREYDRLAETLKRLERELKLL